MTGLRYSKRILENKEKKSKQLYIDHIIMLHSVSGSLLSMANDLDAEQLKKVITNYENIIGELLSDNMRNMQSV
jgi:hypothetical protein